MPTKNELENQRTQLTTRVESLQKDLLDAQQTLITQDQVVKIMRQKTADFEELKTNLATVGNKYYHESREVKRLDLKVEALESALLQSQAANARLDGYQQRVEDEAKIKLAGKGVALPDNLVLGCKRKFS